MNRFKRAAAGLLTGLATMAGPAAAQDITPASGWAECHDPRKSNFGGVDDPAQYEVVDVTAAQTDDHLTLREVGGLGRVWEHTVSPYSTPVTLDPARIYEAPLYGLNALNVDYATNRATGAGGDGAYLSLYPKGETVPACHTESRLVIVVPGGPG